MSIGLHGESVHLYGGECWVIWWAIGLYGGVLVTWWGLLDCIVGK